MIRVCLDLNVWCAELLATRKGLADTACQLLVVVARRGACSLGPTQLVVSWGMLTRVRKVLETDWRVPRTVVDPYLAAIVGYARLGPARTAPLVPLGGTGVMPIRDPEDAHVLDTAIAGSADFLVTANFDDFLTYRSRELSPKRIAVLPHPAGQLVVAHPFQMAEWVRTGRVTLPKPTPSGSTRRRRRSR
ncbi:MAG: PIN domain-containing protein [Gemmatimonadaceae bacterium]